jgi:hypothetical protein
LLCDVEQLWREEVIKYDVFMYERIMKIPLGTSVLFLSV